MQEKEGLFNDFYPVSRMISTFPSLTDCAFSDIFTTAKPFSYQRFRYDSESNQMVGGALSDLGSPAEFELKMDVAFTETSHHMKAYMNPPKVFRKELKIALRRFSEADFEEDFYAYLLGPDALLHMGGDLKKELRFMEARLAELQSAYRQRTGKKLEIVLISDHGNNLVRRGKNIGVRQFLKKSGFKIRKKVKTEHDVAMTIAGPLTSMALFTSPQTVPRLANALTELEGVDIITYPDLNDPAQIHVINSKKEHALILQNKTGYAYRPTKGDPLNYKTFFNGRFASGDAWLAATRTHPYPAAVERIARGHSEITIHGAPVLVSVKEGFESVNGFIKGFYSLKFAGTHGGLADKESNGILMTNFKKTADTTTNRVSDWMRWRDFH